MQKLAEAWQQPNQANRADRNTSVAALPHVFRPLIGKTLGRSVMSLRMESFRKIPWARVLAEGAVIVVSILMAFGIDAWWTGHQSRLDERGLLEELRTTLGEDFESVAQEADTMTAVRGRLVSFIEMLESGVTMDSAEREYQDAFYGLHRFVVITVHYGPYETLKGRGLHLVSDPKLRIQLTSLFEDWLPQLISNSELDQRLSRDRVLPFMLAYLELDSEGNWLARDRVHEATPLGLTLARYRLSTLDQFYLPSFATTLDLMLETLDAIDLELDS